MTDLNAPQPPPTNDVPDNPACWTALIAEGGLEPWLLKLIEERDAMGRAKYGTPLRVWNGRQSEVDALQEALDLVVYLQQCVMRLSEGRGRSYMKHLRNMALLLVRELYEVQGRIPTAAMEGMAQKHTPECIRHLEDPGAACVCKPWGGGR